MTFEAKIKEIDNGFLVGELYLYLPSLAFTVNTILVKPELRKVLLAIVKKRKVQGEKATYSSELAGKLVRESHFLKKRRHFL
jgi:hypothetical protein